MPLRIIRNVTKPRAVVAVPPTVRPPEPQPVEIRQSVTDEDMPSICDGDARFCDHDSFDDGMIVAVNNPRIQIHGLTGTIEFHCEDGTLVVRLDTDGECYLLQEDEVI